MVLQLPQHCCGKSIIGDILSLSYFGVLHDICDVSMQRVRRLTDLHKKYISTGPVANS